MFGSDSHAGGVRRRRRRRNLAALVAGLLIVGLSQTNAFANHYQASLEGSQFQIDNDANFVVDPSPNATLDWANVADTWSADKPTGSADDSYVGGVKEDTVCPGETTGSIPNNKSDLRTFGVYKEPGNPGFLHMFWTRVSDPSGTTLMDFEFNQSKTACAGGPNVVRTNGDLLLEYSIDQGGSRATITLRRWVAASSAWGPATALDPSVATGTINSSVITAENSDGKSSSTLQARTFGEASVNLNVIFASDKCQSFGSSTLKSRASDSFTAQLKDFIRPVPITLTNCGKVVIHKQTDPDGATASFGYTKAFGTDPASSNTFSLTDGGTKTFDGVLFGSGYTVDETTLPTGWDFNRIDCSASSGVTPSIVGSKITFAIDNADDVLDCTYYNKARAKLTVVKQTTDGHGAFDFTSTSLDPNAFTLTTTGSGAAGADSRVFGNLTPGTYDVAETEPAGWNLDTATCDNGDAVSAIKLGAGDDVTCTFVNQRETGAIKITKTRKHAAAPGGTGPQSGVTFTITGGGLSSPVQVVTNSSGTACLDKLYYGDYTVTEVVPAGYVSDDATQPVSVSTESGCGDGKETAVAFHNTPLTDITVSVDSQISGGTSSTISCVDSAGHAVTPDAGSGSTGSDGDGSATWQDQLPTAPDATLVCTITVDP